MDSIWKSETGSCDFSSDSQLPQLWTDMNRHEHQYRVQLSTLLGQAGHVQYITRLFLPWNKRTEPTALYSNSDWQQQQWSQGAGVCQTRARWEIHLILCLLLPIFLHHLLIIIIIFIFIIFAAGLGQRSLTQVDIFRQPVYAQCGQVDKLTICSDIMFFFINNLVSLIQWQSKLSGGAGWNPKTGG